MSASFTIDLHDGLTPMLQRLTAGLSGAGRQHLHEMVLAKALELTREHLREIAGSRHETANKLGASPTGFWAQATEQTSGSADAEAATITVASPGIGRAFHDVTITPGAGKSALTIPVTAEAYGQRAYRVPGLFVWRSPTTGHAFLAQSQGFPSALKVWYLLVASVTQEQDRTLLPSDQEYQQAALQGASDYVDYLLQHREAA